MNGQGLSKPRGLLSSSLPSGSSLISCSSTLANKLENRVKNAVASRRCSTASLGTSFSANIATRTTASSGSRDEDAPLAVQVSDCESQLVLLGLELELANGLIDDESVGCRIELADLAFADVESV